MKRYLVLGLVLSMFLLGACSSVNTDRENYIHYLETVVAIEGGSKPVLPDNCPSGTLAVLTEVKCYTTSDSSNGEYTQIYSAGAIVVSAHQCDNGYVKIQAGCWLNQKGIKELK